MRPATPDLGGVAPPAGDKDVWPPPSAQPQKRQFGAGARSDRTRVGAGGASSRLPAWAKNKSTFNEDGDEDDDDRSSRNLNSAGGAPKSSGYGMRSNRNTGGNAGGVGSRRSGVGNKSDAGEAKSIGRRQMTKPSVPRLGGRPSNKGKKSDKAGDKPRKDGKEKFEDPQFKELVALLEVGGCIISVLLIIMC